MVAVLWWSSRSRLQFHHPPWPLPLQQVQDQLLAGLNQGRLETRVAEICALIRSKTGFFGTYRPLHHTRRHLSLPRVPSRGTAGVAVTELQDCVDDVGLLRFR